MQAMLNFYYQVLANFISWLFSMQIVEGVTLGSFSVVLMLMGLVISNLILMGNR